MFNITDKRVKLRKLPEDLDKINLKYETDVEAINVTLLNTSNLEKLTEYIPELVMATWNEDINEFNKSLTTEDRKRFVFRTLQGKFIPTALESINITFKIEGMTWHDVSHLIRHQNFKFAADCSGDKIIDENRTIAVPEFITELGEFDAYDKAMKELTLLYNKAINNNVHIQDARLMLPRTMTTFYYVTGSLRSCIEFIKQRIDRQVQPKADNIIAIQLLLELCRVIPELSVIISPDMKNNFYINETKTNFASKWQGPLPQNKEVYNYNISNEDFTYVGLSRDEMIGNKSFVNLWNDLLEQLHDIKTMYLEDEKNLEILYDCTEGEWK